MQNEDGRTHLSLLRALVPGADRLIITSPFLARDLGRLAAKLQLQRLDALRLVTALPDELTDRLAQLRSLQSLQQFRERLGGPRELSIQVAPRLHGKAYVLFQGATVFAAVVTSANFSEHGMQMNAEWGIVSRDSDVNSSLLAAINAEPADEIHSAWIDSEADRISAMLPAPFRPPPPHDRTRGAKPTQAGAQIWLKPIGVTESPVEEGRLFDMAEDDLHFSKTRPSGVAVGDIMILYGIGAKRLLGVFSVLDSPREATEAEKALDDWKERWPWYVPAQNLTPLFGSDWWTSSIWATALVEEYLDKNPDGPITAAGGQSLGALNWGADKIRLAEQFGRFVLDAVYAIEEDRARSLSTGGTYIR